MCVCVWNRGLQEPTPASTSPAPTPSIDKPVASSSSSSSSGSEEQSESEAAESDTDASTSSDHARKPSENAKDIAKDDDQKLSQNNQAGHLDDVYQVELEVDEWDGDWLDTWRSPAWLFDKKPESPMLTRRS